jgi:hypothetical protein
MRTGGTRHTSIDSSRPGRLIVRSVTPHTEGVTPTDAIGDVRGLSVPAGRPPIAGYSISNHQSSFVAGDHYPARRWRTGYPVYPIRTRLRVTKRAQVTGSELYAE